jgi:nitric oxide reductase NorQ protein
MKSQVLKIQDYAIQNEPYYQPIGEEIEIFTAAYGENLPVLLKGPTGCGKTRFMEHMAWRLKRPLITVSYHDADRFGFGWALSDQWR